MGFMLAFQTISLFQEIVSTWGNPQPRKGTLALHIPSEGCSPPQEAAMPLGNNS